MTTGVISQPSDGNIVGAGFQYKKDWNGADDRIARSSMNAYLGNKLVAVYQRGWQANPIYPYIPPFNYFIGQSPDYVTCSNFVHQPNANSVLSAITRCREAIKGHDFNASLAFADSEKTLHLLVNAVKNAAGGVKALSRGDLSSFVRALPASVKGDTKSRHNLEKALSSKDIASVWLAAQYGWKPLAADVVAAWKAFQERNLPLRRTQFKSSVRSPVRYVRVEPNGGNPFLAKLEEIVSYAIILEEIPSTLRLTGFGLNNWSSVVWERIPFSFVLDWFIPIGQMLEEFAFFQGLNLKYRQTVWQIITGSASNGWAYPPGPPLDQHGWNPSKVWFRHINLRRTVGNQLGVPIPTLKTFARSLSPAHLKNAAALIYQQAGPSAPNRQVQRRFLGDLGNVGRASRSKAWSQIRD